MDSKIIGVSSDKNYVWFECTLDYIVYYGLIDIKKCRYLLFDPPENYMDYQIQIDFDNGNVIYSDFPFQGTTTDSEETWESKKIFHLYKNNFFTKDINIIDTNIGVGFNIEKNNNMIKYTKEKYRN